MPNPDDLLALGPPPLTIIAADCALDLIDFMAAVVRGVDLIDVTDTMREIWRNYLAAHYPMLAPPDRYWFANAPITLSELNMMWPQLPQISRETCRQAWAVSLPATLQFIEPVLQAARQQQVWHLSHLTDQTYEPKSSQSEVYARQQLHNMQARTESLRRFSTTMADLTIGKMRAMSGYRRIG